MIFEIKNYQKCKQYKINGAVVRKSIFESTKSLYEENAALDSQIEVLKKGVAMRADRLLFVNKENTDLEKEIQELREFKEAVNKELRLWNIEECSFAASFRAVDNLENMMLDIES